MRCSASARIVDLVDRLMRARGQDGRGTVGQMTVLPNSRNVIPGEVRFSVEFRHPNAAEIERLDEDFRREAGALAAGQGVHLSLTELFKLPAQPFDPACVDLVRQAAARLGLPAREIVSGAAHDAVYVARCVPAAMIFTPCAGGLSHNEAESILPEEAEAGCQVLLEALLARANAAHVAEARGGPARAAPSDGWSASARVSKSSTTGASKQTATAPGTSSTSRARAGGRRQRSPGR